jgi:hypothetical protein
MLKAHEAGASLAFSPLIFSDEVAADIVVCQVMHQQCIPHI